jgi:hypothetical protein
MICRRGKCYRGEMIIACLLAEDSCCWRVENLVGWAEQFVQNRVDITVWHVTEADVKGSSVEQELDVIKSTSTCVECYMAVDIIEAANSVESNKTESMGQLGGRKEVILAKNVRQRERRCKTVLM